MNKKVVHERAALLVGTSVDDGSSPRVWGIPRSAASLSVNSPVHPHVCGEYGYAGEGISRPDGSSPRVWGIRMRA